MALLQIAFEVDGEVYPELHAALKAIGSEASRAERLRQLAASGLVWEKLRLGAPVLLPKAAAPQAKRSQQPRAPQQPPPTPAPTEFVDLALDAAPTQPVWPPVLHDVIEPPPPPPEPPLPHQSSTRARLLRMKEKGLFRNG